MVVGSLAEASRQQAGALKDSGRVSAIVVAPETLLAGAQASAWKASAEALSQALAAGRPVLLQIGLSGSPDLAMGGALVREPGGTGGARRAAHRRHGGDRAARPQRRCSRASA